MAIKTINGVLRVDSDKTTEEFNSQIKATCDAAESKDSKNQYVGIIFNARDKRIDLIPSSSISSDFSLLASPIVSGLDKSNSLLLTTLDLPDIYKELFQGVVIPKGQVAFVRGKSHSLDTRILFDTLTNLVTENTYYDFVIVYDSHNFQVYVNASVKEKLVSDWFINFPEHYTFVNMTAYKVQNRIKDLMNPYYDLNKPDVVVFSNIGTNSILRTMKTKFEALQDVHDFVIIFNGKDYQVFFNPSNIMIDDLIERNYMQVG